jgi:hypothetical protein
MCMRKDTHIYPMRSSRQYLSAASALHKHVTLISTIFFIVVAKCVCFRYLTWTDCTLPELLR